MNNSDFILGIYESVTNPSRWSPILDEFSHLMGARAANLFVGDSDTRVLNRTWTSPVLSGISSPEDLSAIASEINLYLALPELIPERGFVDEKQIINDYFERFSEPLDPSTARDLLANKYGIHDRACSPLNYSRHYLDFLTLHYDRPHDAQTRQKYALGNAMLPHIAKAVEISRPFSLLEHMYGAVLDFLDRLQLGVVISSDNGDIWLANTAGQRVIDEGDCFALSVGKRLYCKDKDNAETFSKAIAQATSEQNNTQKSSRISLTRADSDSVYIIDVSVLRNRNLASTSHHSGILLVIVDPEQSQLIDFDRFSELFGLTKAELKVSKLLTQGYTNNEMAEARNVSVETIISQMKSVFNKTGVHKRTQLVHLAHSVNIPLDNTD